MVMELSTTLGIELSQELATLAERVRAAVVEVSDGRGHGAGTVWSPDGLIATNHHVVPGERARVTTRDGRTLDAGVVASLPDRDLAILRVEAAGLDYLPPADLGQLRPGALVLAVGHPLGVRGAVSLGVFSSIGPIEQRQGRHFSEAIMANIELRPGNSGGPLVNARGELVGINSMVMGRKMALAVPVTVVQRLVQMQRPRRLGIRPGIVAVPPLWRERAGATSDALVMALEVVADGPAARAGLLPGDILVAIDGHAIEEPGDIALALGAAGERVTLRLLRAGEPRELPVAFDEA